MTREEFDKLNIGDKVKIRKDLVNYEKYGNETFVEEMSVHCGKFVTIKDFPYDYEFCVEEPGEDGYDDYYYTLEMIGDTFIFGR